MSWRVDENVDQWIVRVEYNDTENQPGEVVYGPFDTEDEAEDFAENWSADDTEIADVWVIYLNAVKKETS